MITAQQLEARVLGTVAAMRSGSFVEDDLVECKRDWPATDRTRQLGGLANRAFGEPFLLIIGIDEATGACHQTQDIDPAEWWGQIGSGFDQVAPDLVRHLTVHIDEGEVVVAMLFATDRAPYVVKASGGNAEREIPIRDGTRTRSCYRHEVMRLLVPSAGLPFMDLLWAELEATYRRERTVELPGHPPSTTPNSLQLRGSFGAYIEPPFDGFVFLPKHGMNVTLSAPGGATPIQMDMNFFRWEQKEATPRGVTYRSDGILAEGPAVFGIDFAADVDVAAKDAIAMVDEWQLRVELQVAARSRPLLLSAVLGHARGPKASRMPHVENLNVWTMTAEDSPGALQQFGPETSA